MAHDVDGAHQQVERHGARHRRLPCVGQPGVKAGHCAPQAQTNEEAGPEAHPVWALEGGQQRDAQRGKACRARAGDGGGG